MVLDYQLNKGYVFSKCIINEAANIYEGVSDWND